MTIPYGNRSDAENAILLARHYANVVGVATIADVIVDSKYSYPVDPYDYRHGWTRNMLCGYIPITELDGKFYVDMPSPVLLDE